MASFSSVVSYIRTKYIHVLGWNSPRFKPNLFQKFSILSVRARFGGKSTGYIQIKEEEEGMRKEVHFEKTKTQNGHDHPCEFVSSWASSRHLVLETQLCRDDVIGRCMVYLKILKFIYSEKATIFFAKSPPLICTI